MKYVIAAVLSAILLQLAPAHFNNSVATSVANETTGQSASKLTVTMPEPTSHVAATPKIEPQPPTPKPPVKPAVVVAVQPPTSAPKQQALATLTDLGQADAWYAVEYIAFKESSWKPQAVNSIGACGLFQALPCSKLKCNLHDVDCQVRWATKYATQRYGSWHQAYTFWKANNWW